jgi:hypothetical protein
LQEGLDILANIVIARPGPEGLGILLVMVEGAAFYFIESVVGDIHRHGEASIKDTQLGKRGHVS